MSLTSQLDDPGSVLSRYLVDRLPHVDRFTAAYGAGSGPLLVSGGESDAMLVGTAFDLMVKLDVAVGVAQSPFHAAFGAGTVAARAVDSIVAQVRSCGVDSSVGVAGCWALAHIGQSSRFDAGRWLMRQENVTPDVYVPMCSVDAQRQLASLYAYWQPVGGWFRRFAPTIAPTFVGSTDVGGADADVVAGPTLVDVKVRLGTKLADGGRLDALSTRDVYQIVCYALLDYDDAYGIREVGVYSARYARLVTWNLDLVCSILAGAPTTVGVERRALRAALTA